MKLSEMNTMQLAAALCKLTPAVARIMESPDMTAAMQQFGAVKETVPAVAYSRLAAHLCPVLLDKHLDDTITILSALTGKAEESIRTQPGHKTISDVKACFDRDLMDFFMPSAGTGQTKSSQPSTNTAHHRRRKR